MRLKHAQYAHHFTLKHGQRPSAMEHQIIVFFFDFLFNGKNLGRMSSIEYGGIGSFCSFFR